MLDTETKINVGPWDIRMGRRFRPGFCPLARAIRQAFRLPLRGRLLVTSTHVEIEGARYNLPATAREFVDRFDAGYVVEPFAFKLAS